MKTYTYESNNSGGRWWLEDEDWKRLEEHGWEVRWFNNDEFYKRDVDSDGRWLDALASSASKEFHSENGAIAEWERIAGQYYSAEGCECCGPPHGFYGE